MSRPTSTSWSSAPGAARLEIGRVGRPHGLRGEVSVTVTSERPERVMPGAVLYTGSRRLVIAEARRHHDRWLLRFEGIDDRDAAERLRGARLEGDPLDDDRDRDELWVHDVVGAEVRDRAGRALGRVATVEANPAHDLLVLEDGALIPAPFVVEHEPGLVVVDVPPGLLEVNQPHVNEPDVNKKD